MTTRKNAAIILLGMGENYAAEVLKTLNHKEVEAIIEIMNNLEDISEQEVIKALNEFFTETQNTSGLHATSGEYIRNTLVSAVGTDKAGSLMDEGTMVSELKGFELLKWQPIYLIADMLRDEHPQIITVTIICLDSNKAAEILKLFPKELSKDVINRMTNCSQVSHFAMQLLSEYFEEQLTKPEKFKLLTADGVNMAADIVSRLDVETENEIISFLDQENKEISVQLQDKLFPFDKLGLMDPRSIQTLLAAVNNEDLVLALKVIDEDLKTIFFKNMSIKTGELLKEDIESTGPVKLSDVLQAQKKIVEFAKKLSEEGKISVPTLKQDTTIF